MLERIRQYFIQDQGARDGLIHAEIDRFEVRLYRNPARFTEGRRAQSPHELLCVLREVDAIKTATSVKVLMDERHGVHALLTFIKRQFRFRTSGRISLHTEQ